MENIEAPAQGFSSTGLSPAILDVLNKINLLRPTQIQSQAIGIALSGKDLIGVAQTGTGKTLAFALPIIQKLSDNSGRAVIIVPTRELALQAEESIRQITGRLRISLRTISLIGGMPIYRQIRELKTSPRIILATPGRLQDHLNQGTLDLNDTTTIVLDEADRMLDMGFMPQIDRIMLSIPKERQTMLFSATMAPEIQKLAKSYLKNDFIKIEAQPAGSDTDLIRQEVCYLSPQDKITILGKLLDEHDGSTLVFSRTKHEAARLASRVREMGHSASEIHSNRSLSQRKQALSGFKSGQYRVLIATDIAARGIDVKEITLVINYDLPDAAGDYIHRIGRTGRAGKNGKAVSFAAHNQLQDIKKIEHFIKRDIPLSKYSQTSINQPVESRPTNNNYRPNANFRHSRHSNRFH